MRVTGKRGLLARASPVRLTERTGQIGVRLTPLGGSPRQRASEGASKLSLGRCFARRQRRPTLKPGVKPFRRNPRTNEGKTQRSQRNESDVFGHQSNGNVSNALDDARKFLGYAARCAEKLRRSSQKSLFGLCPSMCGEAVLRPGPPPIFCGYAAAFRPSSSYARDYWTRSGGIAAKPLGQLSEKRSFSAHRAA